MCLRQYGWDENRISQVPASISRLDSLQAAILRCKLRHLDEDNQRRRAIADRYRSALKNVDLVAPTLRDNTAHVFHQFVIRTKERTHFRKHMLTNDVQTSVHYPLACHQHPAFTSRIQLAPGGLPQTEIVCNQIVSLPMFPQLDARQLERIEAALASWS